MPLNFNLSGRSILVTGASRGIGRSVALALGQEGAFVGVTHTGSSPKSEANAREVCEAITAAGGKALAIALDTANEEQISASVEQMVKTFGKLDGLVNNAGIVIDQLAMRYKSEDFDRIMDVNVRGTFLLCKAAMRPLMKSGAGSIVNMSSVVALSGNAGQVPYSASKAAIIGMTKSLAREVASRQLRVNVIAPGYIQTDMTGALTEEQTKTFAASIALGRLGQPDDIASATLFLLSPLSSYITGQVLSVNGGLYM